MKEKIKAYLTLSFLPFWMIFGFSSILTTCLYPFGSLIMSSNMANRFFVSSLIWTIMIFFFSLIYTTIIIYRIKQTYYIKTHVFCKEGFWWEIMVNEILNVFIKEE